MLSGLRWDRLKKRVFGTGPAKTMSPVEMLMGAARLGMDLEAAKHTELYKYLLQRALAEHESAIADWLTADPTNVSLMVELQGRARHMEALTKWLDDAIQSGYAAHQQVERLEYVDG